MGETLADVIAIPRQNRPDKEPRFEDVKQETIIVSFFDGKKKAVVSSDARPPDYLLQLAGNPVHEPAPHKPQLPPRYNMTYPVPSMLRFWTELLVVGIKGAKKMVEATTGVSAVTERNRAKLRVLSGGKNPTSPRGAA